MFNFISVALPNIKSYLEMEQNEQFILKQLYRARHAQDLFKWQLFWTGYSQMRTVDIIDNR